MWELDVDGGYGEAKQNRWKQVLQKDVGVSYREHNANEYVWQQVNILAGRQELLLSTPKRRKLSWFGHVYRHDML